MKNFFYLFLFLSVGIFSSCEKEEDCVSNCGTITNEDACAGAFEYCITIRNECTDNLQTFSLSYDDWLGAIKGQEFCITNVTSW